MKKRSLIISISTLVFIGAAYILGWSSLFTVSSIEITGTNVYLSTSIKPGQKLARVEPRVVASEFQKIDWIESAHVSRDWLTGKVTITLVERTPIAIYNNLAIDRNGASFTLHSQDVSNLPHIQTSNIESAIIAADFFASLPSNLANTVKIVKVTNGESYILRVLLNNSEIELRWGQNIDSALKSKAYFALMALPENSKVKRIDVSAPHAPIVK